MHLSTAIKFGLVFYLFSSIQAASLKGKQELEIELSTESSTDINTISILDDISSFNPSPTVIPPSADFPPESGATILSQHQEIKENGEFSYSYNTSNGIQVAVIGKQKEIVGPDGEKSSGTVSSGSYSYFFVDNGKIKKMTVNWTADERGFLPVVTISDT